MSAYRLGLTGHPAAGAVKKKNRKQVSQKATMYSCNYDCELHTGGGNIGPSLDNVFVLNFLCHRYLLLNKNACQVCVKSDM